MLAVLPNPEGSWVAAVTLEEQQPKLTTEEANALGVKEVVSTFTTKYPFAPYRLQNIHRAADLIDGTVVLPGETFSMNKIVGERTEANGFAEGIIINNGKFEKDFGGGVSQVATTTYNAAFFAGLKDVQHKAHSFYISRYPAGREATVAWPSVDLKFQNDTPYGLLVDTSYTNSTVTVSIWGTKVYDIEAIAGPRTDPKPFQTEYSTGEGCVPQDGVEGFKIVVTRVFKQGGAEVKREDIKTSYNAANKIYCRAAPARHPPRRPRPPSSLRRRRRRRPRLPRSRPLDRRRPGLAVLGVAYDDPKGGQFVAQPVGGRPVPRRARALPLLEQGGCPRGKDRLVAGRPTSRTRSSPSSRSTWAKASNRAPAGTSGSRSIARRACRRGAVSRSSANASTTAAPPARRAA